MREGEASRTAERVAARRAAHQLIDAPLVFDDPLAMSVVAPSLLERLRRNPHQFDRWRMARYLRAFLAVRSRVSEDELRPAVERGVRQYVVLGAGLDTFAYRNPHPGLRVFEVDHPSTQKRKRARLAAANVATPSSVTFVGVDLSTTPLETALLDAGFDPNQPSFFSWLGVVVYLDLAAIRATLQYVGSLPESTIVFDYGIPPSSLGWLTRFVVWLASRRVKAIGEPWKTYFFPSDLERELQAAGFDSVRMLGPDDINRGYFAGRADGLRVGKIGHIAIAATEGKAAANAVSFRPTIQQEKKSMSRIVKCGLIQTSLAAGTDEPLEKIRDAQIERTLKYIDQAGAEGVQIICMQEIFTGPYFCAEQNPRWYDSVERIPDGPTTKLMQEYAKKYSMVIVVPLYEEESTGVYYNTAAVIDADGTYLGKYRKNHIPHVAPGFWEKYYFRPGNLGYPIFETKYAKVGVYICYDRHFPEGARELGLNGAEIVFNPSATVAGLSEYLWKLEQPAHAVANGYFIGAINRVGFEAPWNIGEFYGQSYFCDPRGQFLAMADRDKDALVTAELDLDKIREVRNTWQFYRDRRPETYGGLVRL